MKKGVSILSIIVVLWLAFSQPHQQVAGVETQVVDPNHPVEVFYGSADYGNTTDMLSALGVTVYPEDKVEAVPPPGMNLGSKITVTRSTPVLVIDAKKSFTYRTWTNNISDLLTEKNIQLLGKDSVEPTATTHLSYALRVVITRVSEVEVTEKETIDYKTITKNDPSRYRDEPDIIQQEGKDGQKLLTYLVTREDGEEVSRKLIKTETTPVQNKIVSHGTEIKIKQTISGRATWYDSKYNAASHLWPKGTKIRVTNPANGKSIETVVDDYMESSSSVVDLKLSLFQQLADPYGTMPNLVVDWILN